MTTVSRNLENRGVRAKPRTLIEKPRPGVMSSKTKNFGSVHVRTCGASVLAGKHRNDTTTQALHRLVNSTNVRFRCNSGFMLDAGSTTSSSSPSSDRLDWEMLAIWVMVVFSFAALAFTGYVIWAKCASPSPL
jgi:hypothetical protein